MNRRNTVWLVPLLLLVTFPLWKIPVSAFLTPRGEINVKEEAPEAPSHSFSMEDLVIYQYSDNKENAVIRSDRAYSDKGNPDIILFDRVDGDVYDKKGDLIKISSKTAAFDQKTQELVLLGDVFADKVESQEQLRTQEMQYDSVKQVAYAPGETTITSPKATIKGGNFTYDMKIGEYRMEKRVNTTLDTNGNGL